MKYVASFAANRLRILSLAMFVAASSLVGGCSGESPGAPAAVSGTPTPPPASAGPGVTQVAGGQTPSQVGDSTAAVALGGGGVLSGDTIKIGVDLPTSSGEDTCNWPSNRPTTAAAWL